MNILARDMKGLRKLLVEDPVCLSVPFDLPEPKCGEHPILGKKVCTSFTSFKHCKFGDRCEFSHHPESMLHQASANSVSEFSPWKEKEDFVLWGLKYARTRRTTNAKALFADIVVLVVESDPVSTAPIARYRANVLEFVDQVYELKRQNGFESLERKAKSYSTEKIKLAASFITFKNSLTDELTNLEQIDRSDCVDETFDSFKKIQALEDTKIEAAIGKIPMTESADSKSSKNVSTTPDVA